MIKVKTFSLLLFLLLTAYLNAQVTVTAVPPGQRFTPEDLWQVTMVRNTAVAPNTPVNVSITVFDKKGNRLMEEITNTFHFIPTVISINKATLSKYKPITLNYFSSKFKTQSGSRGGIFPEGTYKVEVSCNFAGTGFSEPLGKYVYIINADLAYPIQLVSVYNNDTITDTHPAFTWIPPYPLPEGTVKYELTVSEIKANQTPRTAITENTPQYRTNIFNQNSGYYSQAAPILIKGHEYAWQVTAYNRNGDYVSGSESWRFIYFPEDTIEFEPSSYFLMDKKLTSSIAYIDSNYLPIKFISDYQILDSIAHIYIYDEADDIVADETTIPVVYAFGSNYTFIDMCPDIFYLENGIYILEITLVNNQKYYLRFRKNSSTTDCY